MERTQPRDQQLTEQDTSWWSRLRERLAQVGRSLSPSSRAWRGAAVALLAAATLLWVWASLPQVVTASPLTSLLLAGADLLVAVLAGVVLLVVLGGFARLPRLFRWALFAAVVLLITLGAGASQRGWFLAVAVLVLSVSVAGGVLWSLSGGSWKRMRWPGRALTLGALLLSLLVLLGGGWWLLRPGAPAAQIPNAAREGQAVAPLDQPDPSQPGPYTVAQLTYGSGKDLRRPEYGAGVALTTAGVDASKMISGWQGLSGDARTGLWGFDAQALPLNGRVWYPEGEGRFPLVLIVHGNTSTVAFSDAGFAYLGELLASRGFVVASVDQNFLNTGLIDTAGGLSGVNAARGWLLLEHLRVWHEWNAQPDNPFYEKIDTENIALIGHSRGGEAVAIAAAFNRLDRFPDDATLDFDYGYAIRSLVAIAPSDAQYMPVDEKIALRNINYLALQGSLDADVVSFAGLNQFQRIGFSPDQPWFKAAQYIYGANHGQWNSLWDRTDVGEGLAARFIDTAAIMPAEDQRKAAQVMVSAFLEDTLHGQAGYRPLFRDARYGSAWLPDTVYLSQYGDAPTRYLSTFDEDVDAATTTAAGGSLEAANLAQWQEKHLPLRLAAGDSRAVQLGWQRAEGSEAPRYTINLPADGGTIANGSVLRFDIADAGVAAVGGAGLANLSIELRDDAGNTARLPLSHVAPLQPMIEGRYLKSALLHDTPLSEPIMQTYNFPLADFTPAVGAFDQGTLAAVSFVFDDTPAGAIMLDNIGIVPGD